jgi:hypothetical protein
MTPVNLCYDEARLGRQHMATVAAESSGPLRVNNGCAGRSSGTSAVPQIADDIGAPCKLAEVGHNPPSCHLSDARGIGVTCNRKLPNGTC